MLKIHTSASTLPHWIKSYHDFTNMKYVVICPTEDFSRLTQKATNTERGKELCDLLCRNGDLTYSYNIAGNGNVYYIVSIVTKQ